MSAKRIAFTLIQSEIWTGGYNYLVNLLTLLCRYEAERVQPVLFCGEDASNCDIEPFSALNSVEIVRSDVFNTRRSQKRLLKALFFGIDHSAVQLFRRHAIDVVFESTTFYGWRCKIPTIAWLTDFQHRHLREYFGLTAYWRRELGSRARVASGRLVMLSSNDARKDCERFYPKSVGNTAVVRFAVPIDPRFIEEHPELSIFEYKLRHPFFYLPNQFYKHKNHQIVIEALGALKQKGIEIVVAATGNPRDPRDPDFFGRLNQRVESLGLTSNFLILGLVPRLHVISLMRTCVAMINPSFFEGWSSTVEEARAFNTPMVLSDIEVHREQMGNDADYFDPTDAEALAKVLKNIHLNNLYNPSIRNISAQCLEREQRFANEFATIVHMAVSRRNKR